ncbi:MAG: hypothetical protein ACXWB9_05060 [Flavisolibacter sp.]
MKTFISYCVLAILLLASSSTIANQQQINEQQESTEVSSETCFNQLRVKRQGKAVIDIFWAVSKTEIDHFVIERSDDGKDFKTVKEVSFNNSTSYKMNDKVKADGTIHYRVTAVFQDGSMETSPVKSV